MSYKWAMLQTDKNQKDIVKKLRCLPGISVALKHDDILVGVCGQNLWYEIKNSDAANKKCEVFNSAKKQSQIDLEKNWKGHYRIVTTFKEIFDDIKDVQKNMRKP